jgi:NIMA-interacting peptidyl-prolyl cis-trans isomerase 1
MRSLTTTFTLVLGIAALGCDEPSAAPPAASSSPAVPSSVPSTPPSAAAEAVAGPASAAASSEPDTIIAQHILVAYRSARRAPKGVTRSKTDAKARAGEALAKIRSGTAFEDAVSEYSDDAGSADRMGSVGKFHRDQMDPAFSAAAFALRVGQVSDVVETPFGFHIIKRTQ